MLINTAHVELSGTKPREIKIQDKESFKGICKQPIRAWVVRGGGSKGCVGVRREEK